MNANKRGKVKLEWVVSNNSIPYGYDPKDSNINLVKNFGESFSTKSDLMRIRSWIETNVLRVIETKKMDMPLEDRPVQAQMIRKILERVCEGLGKGVKKTRKCLKQIRSMLVLPCGVGKTLIALKSSIKAFLQHRNEVGNVVVFYTPRLCLTAQQSAEAREILMRHDAHMKGFKYGGILSVGSEPVRECVIVMTKEKTYHQPVQTITANDDEGHRY